MMKEEPVILPPDVHELECAELDDVADLDATRGEVDTSARSND